MRLSRTIPAELHAAVVTRSRENDPATGKPFTYVGIAAWLNTEHGVQASRMAVCRVLAGVHERGEELIVAALRDELRDAVGPAKRALTQAVKRLDEQLKTETKTERLASGVRALSTALGTLAKLGGVAAPVTVDLTSGGQPLPDAHAALAAAVARLAAEPGAGGAGEADPEPPA